MKRAHWHRRVEEPQIITREREREEDNPKETQEPGQEEAQKEGPVAPQEEGPVAPQGEGAVLNFEATLAKYQKGLLGGGDERSPLQLVVVGLVVFRLQSNLSSFCHVIGLKFSHGN